MAINNAHIQDLAVTTFKIGNTAITEEKIANLAVTNSKIKNVEANKITTNIAKIKVAQIERLEVGSNVIMGSNATISWGQVIDQPFIPDTDFITTITEDTIMTINLYARNLTVSAANITGTLEADQIASNISRVNWSLEVGSLSEYGEILLYGGGSGTGTYIKGHRRGMEIYTCLHGRISR